MYFPLKLWLIWFCALWSLPCIKCHKSLNFKLRKFFENEIPSFDKSVDGHCQKDECESHLETSESFTVTINSSKDTYLMTSEDKKIKRIGTVSSNAGGYDSGFTLLSIKNLNSIEGYFFGYLDGIMCAIISEKNNAKSKTFCGSFSSGIAMKVCAVDEKYIKLSLKKNLFESKLEMSTHCEEESILTFIPPSDDTLDEPLLDIFSVQLVWLHLQTSKHPVTPFKTLDSANIYAQVISDLSQLPLINKQTESDVYCAILWQRDMKWRRDNKFDLEMTSLSCYPGSGSEFLQTVIAETTLLDTARFDNFLPLTEKNRNTALLTKGHHQRADYCTLGRKRYARKREKVPWRLDHVLRFSGRVVLLIRNPFKALVSYWNHMTANKMRDNRNIEADIKSIQFREFFFNEIKLWYEIASDWLSTGSRVTVVHFEELIRQPHQEIGKIIKDFLKLQLVQERLNCTLQRNDQIGNFRRKTKFKLKKEMFSEAMIQTGEAYMKRMDKLLRAHGFPELPLSYYW